MGSFIDLNSYDGPSTIEGDICIAGAGAAGITLARHLAKTSRRVILLESGGMQFDARTQALCIGKVTGAPYFSLASVRLRYFGGTTNHWGGYNGLPARIDFEGRPELGVPAWPIGYDDLAPYIDRAANLLGFPREHLDVDFQAARSKTPLDMLIDAKSDDLKSHTFVAARPENRKFGHRYEDELAALPGLDIFLNANVTHIQLTENGAETAHLDVKTLGGKAVKVRASQYILACHAIENARLLLASDDIMSAGVGNDADHVGRYFMDHIHVASGAMIAEPTKAAAGYFSDPALPVLRRPARFVVALRDEALRRQNMMQYYCGFAPGFHPAEQRAVDASDRLYRAFFRPFDRQILDDVGALMGDLSSARAGFSARVGIAPRRPVHLMLDQRIEQAPNPDSRVTLTSERDALGVPVVQLHWALSDLDYHTFAAGQAAVLRDLSAAGLGRISPAPMTREFIDTHVLGHYHNMGTTRMSSHARAGVVDRNCKVFGVDNLYIAGSGVYPTGGASGPTMMIVALSLRLADHLNAEGDA